jgi:hypothetical protein
VVCHAGYPETILRCTMKRVFIARHSAEAHFVRGLLETEGIQAEVRGEDLSGVRGGVPITPDTSPAVWIVEDSEAEQAGALVKRYETGTGLESASSSSWQCSRCGEQVEGQFTSCWKCGTDRMPG